MNTIDNSRRTLTQADVNAIADMLSKGEFVKNLAVKFAQIVGVKIQDEDIIDSETACHLLYNISPSTLKRYAAIFPELRPGGKYSRGYRRKCILEFKSQLQQVTFRKKRIYPTKHKFLGKFAPYSTLPKSFYARLFLDKSKP